VLAIEFFELGPAALAIVRVGDRHWGAPASFRTWSGPPTFAIAFCLGCAVLPTQVMCPARLLFSFAVIIAWLSLSARGEAVDAPAPVPRARGPRRQRGRRPAKPPNLSHRTGSLFSMARTWKAGRSKAAPAAPNLTPKEKQKLFGKQRD
jgi:hypothetical protein